MNTQIKKTLKKFRNKYDFYFGHNRFVKEKGNRISYGNNCRFINCNVVIHGKNNSIEFGNDCNLNGLRILIEGENNIIVLGNGVVVNASKIKPTVINALGGTEIRIGEGSLFSNNIEIHSTDYHGIYNKNGERINPDKNIVIGRYVWIGMGSKVLKGTEIPDGVVVGAGSVVSGKFVEENTIIAGNPAKIIKREIFWKPQRLESYPVPKELQKKWNI